MKKIAFWYDYGIAYAAGLNYFKNLLYAINKAKCVLNDNRYETILFIGKDLSPDEEKEFSAITKVIKVNLLTRGTFSWFLHRILYKLGSQYMIEQLMHQYEIDVISHTSMISGIVKDIKFISWIPDFQYLHLPQYFPKK
jgi:hypothetical protein